MVMEFAVVVGVILLLIVLAPFFVGEGGALEASAALDDVEKVEAVKTAFLRRYLKEEEAAKEGLISEGIWKKRKQLLIGRYLDVARRGDMLQFANRKKGH